MRVMVCSAIRWGIFCVYSGCNSKVVTGMEYSGKVFDFFGMQIKPGRYPVTRQAVLLILLHFFGPGFSQPVSKWVPHNISSRTFNAVQMLEDNTILVAGGNQYQDDIRTIDISYNHGQSWGILEDHTSPGWIRTMTFWNSAVGYAAGDTGVFMKSLDFGNTWNLDTLPGIMAGRDYNGIFFLNADTGFVVGGLPFADSIQTIARTNDGGNTWIVQRDTPGPWLKDIYFVSSTTGFAIGSAGAALKTTDGGVSWNAFTLPAGVLNRDLNSIKFSGPDTGVIVGGQRISGNNFETIIRTTDAGVNWTILRDTQGFSLNSICFYDSAQAITVGDSGVMLYSKNQGTTWSPLVLPDTINDFGDLYSVSFANRYFGAAVGLNGKSLIFLTDSLPSTGVSVEPVTFLGPDSVNLKGIIHGPAEQAIFEYGNSASALSWQVASGVHVVQGNGMLEASAKVKGLQANTWYYYRLKVVNEYGVTESAVDSFFNNMIRGEIPNWDFENWDTFIAQVPVGYYAWGNVQRVSSYDGSHAVKLSPYTGDGALYQTSYLVDVISTASSIGQIRGGTPFTARPDSLIIYLNYDISAGDTGYVMFGFRSGGNITTIDRFPIAGSTGGNFVRSSFPISYQTADIPDSALLGITNSYPYGGVSSSTSTISFDNISFAGTSQNLPNADFENWVNDTVILPQSWPLQQFSHGNGWPIPYKRTTDSYSGRYALEIDNDTAYQSDGITVDAGRIIQNIIKPGFPLFHKPSSLNGYFKYFPDGNDSLVIQYFGFYHDSIISFQQFICDTLVSRFTPFVIPIGYVNGAIPDSAGLSISSTGRHLHGNTRLIIDDLSFDGFISPFYDSVQIISQITEVGKHPLSVRVFPNPSSSVLHLELNDVSEESIEVNVADMDGRTLKRLTQATSAGINNFGLDVSSLPAGMYVLCVKGSQMLSSVRFVKLQ